MSERNISRVAIDASVVIKLWSPTPERHVERVEELVSEWIDGRLRFVAPILIELEVLNIASRKWRFDEPALLVLIAALEELQVAGSSPPLERIAHWSTRGLSAYDAAYVAVAEAAGVRLVTDDDQIVAIAPEVAVALGEWSAAA